MDVADLPLDLKSIVVDSGLWGRISTMKTHYLFSLPILGSLNKLTEHLLREIKYWSKV